MAADAQACIAAIIFAVNITSNVEQLLDDLFIETERTEILREAEENENVLDNCYIVCLQLCTSFIHVFPIIYCILSYPKSPCAQSLFEGGIFSIIYNRVVNSEQ